MAEGLDPDERGSRQKNESILLWLKNVETASQHVPYVPDRGLISNPDLTSFTHDPTRVMQPSATDPIQAPLPPHTHHPTTVSAYNPQELLPQLQCNRPLATRSASFSLSSKLPTTILSRLPPSRSSLRHSRGPPGKSEKKPSLVPIPQHLPSASAQSQNIVSNSGDQDLAAKDVLAKPVEKLHVAKASKETENHLEEKKEAVLAKDDVMSGEEEGLREVRSLINTRQSSLSPLPAPTALPSLPTFNLSDVRGLPPKHPWLKKKLPTVTGVRPWGRARPTPTVKLLRATTSPCELSTAIQLKSAPSSPKPSRAMPTSEGNEGTSMRNNQKEGEKSGTLERHKSFSHDDVTQLQQFDQLNIGGVSPAVSTGSINEGAPGSQQSLVAKGGSSGEGEKSEHSVGKVESIPSDEAVARDNSEGLPSCQSISPVVSDRADSDSANHTSHYRPQSSSLLLLHKEDQKKVGASSSMCPLSPPSLSSPRTPHSPLMRQRHISQSPSPSLPHTPPTSPLHKSWMPGSHSGTESGNVISKKKLKLLNEGQTFSFDTSEDSDFTKLSKQPKFLLKKCFQSCPISPPPSLLSPPSPQRSPSTTDSANPHTHRAPSPTQLSGPSIHSKNSALSEQLLLRCSSTPVGLTLMPTQQGVSPFSAKTSRLANNRSSIHSAGPSRSVTLSPQATRKFTPPKSIEELKESNFKYCATRDIGIFEGQSVPDKGSVNRQDSGLGTLSTISNKFNL